MAERDLNLKALGPCHLHCTPLGMALPCLALSVLTCRMRAWIMQERPMGFTQQGGSERVLRWDLGSAGHQDAPVMTTIGGRRGGRWPHIVHAFAIPR